MSTFRGHYSAQTQGKSHWSGGLWTVSHTIHPPRLPLPPLAKPALATAARCFKTDALFPEETVSASTPVPLLTICRTPLCSSCSSRVPSTSDPTAWPPPRPGLCVGAPGPAQLPRLARPTTHSPTPSSPDEAARGTEPGLGS